MATSGALNTNSYSDAYLRLEWTRTSYDSARGINYVHWILKGVKSSSGYYWARNFKVTSYNFVTGNTTELYNSASDIQLYNGTVIAEGNEYFTTNSDGTCRIQFNIEGAIYSYSVNCTGYDAWDIDQVPRYASITSFTVSNISGNDGLTKLKFNWQTSDTIDYVWYSTNNGSTWIGYDVTDGTSGNFNVGGLSYNTSYKCKLRVRRKDSQLTTDSNVVTKSTYNIATVTSAPNINLGNNATVSISNPAGASIKYFVEILNPTQTVLKRNASTGNNTIVFTDEELDMIFKKMGASNSTTLRFGVATNESYWHWLDKICTLTGNQKTGHVNVSNSWKRSKKWVNVNGVWKRCVRWVNVNGTWKRCI